MIIYGASGHAKVVIDCLRARGMDVIALFDDNPAVTKLLDLKVRHQYHTGLYPGKNLLIAIGNNQIRQKIAEKVASTNPPPPVLSHPTSFISGDVEIGDGSVVLHNATIQSSARIGRFVIINTGATVDHDCELGDFVHVAPNATLCGLVKVGDLSLIGAGSVVIPTIRIGKGCVVGAGAVVIQDVPDFSMVVGNPARIVKKLT